VNLKEANQMREQMVSLRASVARLEERMRHMESSMTLQEEIIKKAELFHVKRPVGRPRKENA